jgi:hypothetical protein
MKNKKWNLLLIAQYIFQKISKSISKSIKTTSKLIKNKTQA